MAVVDPVKLVLTNLPEGHEELLTFSNHPKDESFGSREVPFAREVWIDREDFAEVPPKGWKRPVPSGEVRLRGAGIIRCDEVIKDADGTITELRGWLDPESRPGMEGANRKVKGTIHWVSAVHGVPAEIRLYDRLFSVPNRMMTRKARPTAITSIRNRAAPSPAMSSRPRPAPHRSSRSSSNVPATSSPTAATTPKPSRCSTAA